MIKCGASGYAVLQGGCGIAQVTGWRRTTGAFQVIVNHAGSEMCDAIERFQTQREEHRREAFKTGMEQGR